MGVSAAVKLSSKIIWSWWGSVPLASQGNEFEIYVMLRGIFSNFSPNALQNTPVLWVTGQGELANRFGEEYSQICAQNFHKIPWFCGSNPKESWQTHIFSQSTWIHMPTRTKFNTTVLILQCHAHQAQHAVVELLTENRFGDMNVRPWTMLILQIGLPTAARLNTRMRQWLKFVPSLQQPSYFNWLCPPQAHGFLSIFSFRWWCSLYDGALISIFLHSNES